MREPCTERSINMDLKKKFASQLDILELDLLSDISINCLGTAIGSKSIDISLSMLNELFHELKEVDIWFPIIHGPNGEDGTIQGLFKLTQKPFVGSDVLGSALGMDKIAMKAVFCASGLPQVDYIPIQNADLFLIASH